MAVPEKILRCSGIYQDLDHYKLKGTTDITYEEYSGTRKVGCTFLDEKGFCMRYKKGGTLDRLLNEANFTPKLRKCVHLFPLKAAKKD